MDADRTEELADALRDLRAELRRPPRGPLGVPRPPTLRELSRFTEQYTIPALIALLEAHVRALELLAATLRVLDGREFEGSDARRRAAAAGRETLERVDDVLADLDDALSGEPTSEEARNVLAEARDLREEIDASLAGATGDRPGSDAVDGDASTVDVESELRSIRDELEDGGENSKS